MLDVGCGTGETLLRLARAVGPAGRVTGVDISKPMLAVAARRAAGLPAVETAQADAASHPFPPGGIDLLFSRFGVMFFDDPAAAFRNLRGALAPSGRLAFVCWQPLAANAWFQVPLEVARPLVPQGAEADPEAPGPFAFARPERVRDILAAAGFGAVHIQPLAVSLAVGPPGPEAVAEAARFVTPDRGHRAPAGRGGAGCAGGCATDDRGAPRRLRGAGRRGARRGRVAGVRAGGLSAGPGLLHPLPWT